MPEKNAKKCNLRPGDTVLVKQPKRNKSMTPFNPKPYEIISKNGSMITAANSLIVQSNLLTVYLYT